jgi:hypothetical protein
LADIYQLEQTLKFLFINEGREGVMILKHFGCLSKTYRLAFLVVLIEIRNVLGVKSRIGVLIIEIFPQFTVFLHHQLDSLLISVFLFVQNEKLNLL